ncbi:site-specific DNA-methyltransferase [Roseiflexus sp.]|uniref:site-specific DNA-methyltransferase n=1 Tax=Roseiflexus sp. TaxID=2562120 RepID=UPI0021DE514B|nr:site-specific DNA-methyltransferase [Roseiflexus sp.]GIW00279.1 MAG: hypothetical protein KatS3mg058_1682 [Roseiflexus sp.]
MSFNAKLTNLLKTDPRFVDDNGELVLAAVQDAAWKIDHALVKLLLSNKEIKAKFFDEIECHRVFNTNTFLEYISQKNFLDNSYTRFRNRIGLTIDGKYSRERGEVLSLLRETEGLRYFAVVTDKWRVLDYVRQQNLRNPAYRYRPNELYDYLTRRLFKNLLHKDGGCYEIVFAKRGASDRTAALQAALETARQRFAQQWGVAANAPIRVISSTPPQHAGLQAADYFTWAPASL